MSVGIRELKARLSEYVHRAEGGEIVSITDRGRVTALLIPARGHAEGGEELPEAIAKGIAEGWISAPTRRATWHECTPFAATASIQQTLDEDRNED